MLAAAGIGNERDGGFVRLSGSADAAAFVSACRNLRFWDRVRSRHLAKR
jgi:hypothetical protein